MLHGAYFKMEYPANGDVMDVNLLITRLDDQDRISTDGPELDVYISSCNRYSCMSSPVSACDMALLVFHSLSWAGTERDVSQRVPLPTENFSCWLFKGC